MLPIKKIIAPTDFSEASQVGLQAAAELGNHFSAELHLVHVVAPIPEYMGAHAPTGFHIPNVLKELQAGARKSLQEILGQEMLEGIETDSCVATGEPATEITRLANEIGADVIVMATHGVSGWKRLVTGSVTEKVIRHADVAVLSVCGNDPDETDIDTK